MYSLKNEGQGTHAQFSRLSNQLFEKEPSLNF